MPHGNSYQNIQPHHLYVIYDKETDDVDKYGITDDLIEEDGLSERIRGQLELFNRIARWPRFFALILIRNIPGRQKARAIEKEHIRSYWQEHGQRPPGNLTD